LKTTNAQVRKLMEEMSKHGRQITLPRRFLPDQDLLEYHRANVFRG